VVHFLEEAPGFVPWFNAHVSRGISDQLFWAVNLAGLAITVGVSVAFWAEQSAATAVIAVVWFSFLMLANALFHFTGAIVDQGYVPGLITAICLYIPYWIWIARGIIRRQLVAPGLFVGAALIGAIPMAVHGYRILFLGGRLF
jgi:hypothetical protein